MFGTTGQAKQDRLALEPDNRRSDFPEKRKSFCRERPLASLPFFRKVEIVF
jgi:hypothetical protein